MPVLWPRVRHRRYLSSKILKFPPGRLNGIADHNAILHVFLFIGDEMDCAKAATINVGCRIAA